MRPWDSIPDDYRSVLQILAVDADTYNNRDEKTRMNDYLAYLRERGRMPTPQPANLHSPRRITAAISSSLDECFSNDKAKIASSASIELPQFQPRPEALLRPLLNGDITLTSVPRNPSELFLLFHDLQNEEASKTPAFEYIEECGSNGPAALYGTSGAGKTRAVFEYLSRNKGIYLVSQPSPRDPGSEDLLSVFSGLEHMREESKTERNKAISQDNLKVVVQRLQVLLYVRKAVHDRIQLILKRDLSAYEWLLIQLFPDHFLGEDIFHIATAAAYKHLDGGGEHYEFDEGLPNWKATFVDETQQLLEKGHNFFLSENGKEKRPRFSALLKAFMEIHHQRPQVGYPVFAGTGLSIEELNKESLSAVAKRELDPYEPLFFRFEPLSPGGVRAYLGKFLDLSQIDDGVIEHVCKWLQGRPRFAATFVEEFLARIDEKKKPPKKKKNKSKSKKKKGGDREDRTTGGFDDASATLMQALDRFLADMTTSRRNRRKSWLSGDTTAYGHIERAILKHPSLESVLENAIFQYAVNAMPARLGEDKKELVACGVAALVAKNDSEEESSGEEESSNEEESSDEESSKEEASQKAASGQESEGEESDEAGDKDDEEDSQQASSPFVAVIQEPIMVQAGINVFDLEKVLDRHLGLKVGGDGDCFERVMLPALQRRIRGMLASAFPDDNFKDYFVSSKSSYGVLAWKCDENDLERTIGWLESALNAKFEGTVPPFCFPDNLIGPDLLFLMWDKEYKRYRVVLCQAKFKTKSAQAAGLRTLVPERLYHELRDKEDERRLSGVAAKNKLYKEKWSSLFARLVGDDYWSGCIRILVQYPAHTSAIAGRYHEDTSDDRCGCTTERQKKLFKIRHEWLLTLDERSFLFNKRTKVTLNYLKTKRQKLEEMMTT